jgi:hypothetical protein
MLWHENVPRMYHYVVVVNKLLNKRDTYIIFDPKTLSRGPLFAAEKGLAS